MTRSPGKPSPLTEFGTVGLCSVISTGLVLGSTLLIHATAAPFIPTSWGFGFSAIVWPILTGFVLQRSQPQPMAKRILNAVSLGFLAVCVSLLALFGLWMIYALFFFTS